MGPIAVLGCGSIGQRHIANVLSLGHGPVLAYDPLPAVCERIRSQHGVDACSRLTEVWSAGPTLALICAPSNLHTTLALDAAHYGCHLFIEKPLAHCLDHLEDLAALVWEKGLVTMVGCNMRFHPGPALVKEWLAQGVVGDVLAARFQTGSYLPRWRPWQNYRDSYSASPEWGGAVLDCIHELDLALWLLGPAKVRAAVTRPAHSIGLETDGLAEIILEHECGAITNVHLNFVQQNYRRSIQLIGSQGTIEWDFTSGVVELFGPDGASARRRDQEPAWQINQMYLDEMAYFLHCVQAGQSTCNPLATAEATLRLALAVRGAA